MKTTTYTIMGQLMSDNVAMLYSWTGAKQKKEKLEESPLRKIIESKFNIYVKYICIYHPIFGNVFIK